MQPYGSDLRTRIVEAYDNQEGSVRDLAERFVVAPNTVQNYLNLRRQTGSLAPHRPGGRGSNPLIDEEGLQEVRRLVAEQPDATESELARQFERRRRVAVSRATMGRALRRLGLTRKKKRFTPQSGTPRGDTRRARTSFDVLAPFRSNT